MAKKIRTISKNVTTTDSRISIWRSDHGIDLYNVYMTGISDSVVSVFILFDGETDNYTYTDNYKVRLASNMAIPQNVSVQLIDKPLLIRGRVLIEMEVTGEVDIMFNLCDLFPRGDEKEETYQRDINTFRNTGGGSGGGGY
tara:strand:+ start:1184 stop:1606 length:423 start_codon:yes stop_codon:yes gene_type:complete